MSNKIRVMHLINSFSLAGAEKLVFDLSKKMNKDKFEVYVCSIGPNKNHLSNAIRDDLHRHGVNTFSLNKKPNKKRIMSVLNLRALLLRYDIDILNTHCPSPDFYGRIAALISGTKNVFCTIHTTQGYSISIEYFLRMLTTKYIAISDQVMETSSKDTRIPKRKIEIINNGINIERFKNESVAKIDIFQRLGLDSNKKIITNIGRVTKAKGQYYLIEAARKVLEKHPNVHFLIVGETNDDKPYADSLIKMVNEYKLNSNITFAGVRDDISDILSITDILVFPSLWEGFALVTIEAIASGVPLIATDVGSIREVVVDGYNGIIIPPKDVDAIVDKIFFMLNDMKKTREMGIKGKFVAEKFSIEETVRKYEALYLKYFRST